MLISRLIPLPFDSGPLDQSQARRDGSNADVRHRSVGQVRSYHQEAPCYAGAWLLPKDYPHEREYLKLVPILLVPVVWLVSYVGSTANGNLKLIFGQGG